MSKVILGVSKRKDSLPKKLRFIVLITQKTTSIINGNKPSGMSKTAWDYLNQSSLEYVGFSGGTNEHPLNVTQFFTGHEKESMYGRIVQLPTIFHNKQNAKNRIKAHKKIDNSFSNNKHEYIIVPIDTDKEE